MSHQDLSSYPIMLVDDETDALSLLKSFLCHEGFRKVVTFDDSMLALENFKNEEVALVVIDLRMPKLHGKELLEAFSELKPYVPVIVVTAESHIETAIDCMKTGAVDYLTKPISINRFIAGVKRALELRSLNEDIMLLDKATDDRTTTSKLSTSLLKKIIAREQEPVKALMGQGTGVPDLDCNGITFPSLPTLKYAETVLIDKALELARNNQGTAARMLGISRQALNNRLRRTTSKATLASV